MRVSTLTPEVMWDFYDRVYDQIPVELKATTVEARQELRRHLGTVICQARAEHTRALQHHIRVCEKAVNRLARKLWVMPNAIPAECPHSIREDHAKAWADLWVRLTKERTQAVGVLVADLCEMGAFNSGDPLMDE
jgi:hypothetical protein